jgi:hypothetical protein
LITFLYFLLIEKLVELPDEVRVLQILGESIRIHRPYLP